MPVVLGLDPGFSRCGYCRFGLDKLSQNDKVVSFGVIKTSKSSKKRKILAADDNLDRAGQIAKKLWKLSKDASAICAESMSFPRNASVAAKMAMCWGIISAIAIRRGIPVLQATPQEIKMKICGEKTASKLDIQEKLNKTYVECLELGAKIAKGQQEHCYDSLAAVITCLDSSHLKLLRKIQQEK